VLAVRLIGVCLLVAGQITWVGYGAGLSDPASVPALRDTLNAPTSVVVFGSGMRPGLLAAALWRRQAREPAS